MDDARRSGASRRRRPVRPATMEANRSRISGQWQDRCSMPAPLVEGPETRACQRSMDRRRGLDYCREQGSRRRKVEPDRRKNPVRSMCVYKYAPNHHIAGSPPLLFRLSHRVACRGCVLISLVESITHHHHTNRCCNIHRTTCCINMLIIVISSHNLHTYCLSPHSSLIICIRTASLYTRHSQWKTGQAVPRAVVQPAMSRH